MNFGMRKLISQCILWYGHSAVTSHMKKYSWISNAGNSIGAINERIGKICRELLSFCKIQNLGSESFLNYGMHYNTIIVLSADQTQTYCITMKTSFILPIIILDNLYQ